MAPRKVASLQTHGLILARDFLLHRGTSDLVDLLANLIDAAPDVAPGVPRTSVGRPATAAPSDP